MPTLVEELSARAKTLPLEDRARLAERLAIAVAPSMPSRPVGSSTSL